MTTAPTGMLLTTYTYDQFNHLTGVSMPRNTSNGPYTQTRTFVYASATYSTLVLPALWLTSATNPENGTVSYTYNADGTLASKTDANGNTETYTYDAYQRLTGIPDRQQTFTYDTCPANATGCVSMAGQLMQATFGSNVGPNELGFEYNYAYVPTGQVSSKTLEVQSANHISQTGSRNASGTAVASYTYDTQGALTQMYYFPSPYPEGGEAIFTYTLDALERPTALTDSANNTWATGVTYNAANQSSFGGRTYNSLFQLTQVSQMTYNYSGTKNNGQITSSVDGATGETIAYQYDALKRLLSASGKNWGETYTYDGYGNMTQMAPTGTAGAPSLSVTVDPTTNRLTASSSGYDNNGNLTYGFGIKQISYDAANRVSELQMSGYYNYGYDSDNRRIYYRNNANAETVYLYGADGKKLTSYTVTLVNTISDYYELELTPANNDGNVYFAGIMLAEEGNPVTTDRIGSVRSGGPNNLGYQAQFPYGVEYAPTTANDREKYATYTRDSLTGLDYAMNRYYSSQWGRFLSADPNGGSANASNPQSWNRYAYAGNDPANHNDPSGLFLSAQQCIGDPSACFAEDGEPPYACDLFGGCQPGCASDANGSWNGFLPMPGPSGPICPSLIAPELPQVSVHCEYTLEYRPVEPYPEPGPIGLLLNLFNHSYLDVRIVTDVNDGGDTFSYTSELVMEGLPQNSIPGHWGNLVGLQEPVRDGVVVSPAGFPPSLDNPQYNSKVGSIWDDCQGLARLEAAAAAFPKNTPYNPVPGLFFGLAGENSNYYAWWLTTTAGLPFAAPPAAPGWPW